MIRRAHCAARRHWAAPDNSGPAAFGDLVAAWYPEDAVTSGTDVTGWSSRYGGVYALSVGGAPQYSATGWNASAPAITFDGVDDAVYHGTLGSVFAAGNDRPWYAVIACEIVVAAVNASLIACADSVSTTTPRHMLRVAAADASRWTAYRTADSGSSVDVTSAVGTVTAGRRVLSIEFSGTTLRLRDNGTPVTDMDGAGQDTPTASGIDTFALAATWRAGALAAFANFRYGPVLLYSSLANEAGARTYLTGLGYT